MHNSCNHSHGSSLYSSIFGPLYTVSNTYDLLVNHIGIDRNKLHAVSLIGFSGSFAFSVGAAFVRTKVVETSLTLLQHAMNKELPSDLRTLIAVGISCKLLESVLKICGKGFEKFTAAAVINSTYSVYKPKDQSDIPQNGAPADEQNKPLKKEQIVHHINKVIEHAVHYVFESASALYAFGYGLHSLRNSHCNISATVLFIAASVAVNYLIQSTVHNKLHGAKEKRNEVNSEAQKQIGSNTYQYNSSIGDTAFSEGVWKSVYEEAGSVSAYLSEKMRLGVCFYTLVYNTSINVALLLDSLEKVGEFFAHALEHGDDTADDRVFTKRIMDTVGKKDHQR